MGSELLEPTNAFIALIVLAVELGLVVWPAQSRQGSNDGSGVANLILIPWIGLIRSGRKPNLMTGPWIADAFEEEEHPTVPIGINEMTIPARCLRDVCRDASGILVMGGVTGFSSSLFSTVWMNPWLQVMTMMFSWKTAAGYGKSTSCLTLAHLEMMPGNARGAVRSRRRISLSRRTPVRMDASRRRRSCCCCDS